MKGIPELTNVLATVMRHTFMPDVEIDPQCLVVASGAPCARARPGATCLIVHAQWCLLSDCVRVDRR